jgi:SAM-dependent methyltransferase
MKNIYIQTYSFILGKYKKEQTMSYAYDNDEFSRYYDTFVAEHIPSDVFFLKTVKNVYAEIIQRTFIDNQCTIALELGCGTGENLIYLKNFFKNRNIKFIGIDHSQAMLDRAREKLIDQSINSIEYLHGNLTNFSECLEAKTVDCILLPAGTFHHLITDTERQELISNIQQKLRPETGLFAIYLFPDSLIHVEPTSNSNDQEKLKLISAENIQQSDNEWICKQIFEFDIPPKIELSWQLRTCSISKVIHLFISNNFQLIFCCLNGKDLQLYNENIVSSLNNISTPVILVFRTIKNTN